METLLQKLKKTESLTGVDMAKRINDLYNEFPNEKAVIDEFMDNRFNTLIEKTDNVIEEAIRYKLGEVSEMLSLSYIARNYFSKSRQWLNHRLNANIINGKPAKFTKEQLTTLHNALQDISKKIGSVNIT